VGGAVAGSGGAGGTLALGGSGGSGGVAGVGGTGGGPQLDASVDDETGTDAGDPADAAVTP
jgi:hypothetical protein